MYQYDYNFCTQLYVNLRFYTHFTTNRHLKSIKIPWNHHFPMVFPMVFSETSPRAGPEAWNYSDQLLARFQEPRFCYGISIGKSEGNHRKTIRKPCENHRKMWFNEIKWWFISHWKWWFNAILWDVYLWDVNLWEHGGWPSAKRKNITNWKYAPCCHGKTHELLMVMFTSW